MNKEEQVELLEDRALTYTFLAQGYRQEVSLEMLEALKNAPPTIKGILGDFLSSLSMCDLGQIRTDIAADYAALFLGMSSDPIAPYESVYTSGEQLLMQKARDKICVFYQEEQMGIAESFKLPEDHCALELEFAALLCTRCAEALRGGNEEGVQRYQDKQKEFITCHLVNWIPALCEEVKSKARTDFYRGLAEMTDEFIRLEEEFL